MNDRKWWKFSRLKLIQNISLFPPLVKSKYEHSMKKRSGIARLNIQNFSFFSLKIHVFRGKTQNPVKKNNIPGFLHICSIYVSEKSNKILEYLNIISYHMFWKKFYVHFWTLLKPEKVRSRSSFWWKLKIVFIQNFIFYHSFKIINSCLIGLVKNSHCYTLSFITII